MNSSLSTALDLTPLRQPTLTLNALLDRGWKLDDHVGDVRVTVETRELEEALRALESWISQQIVELQAVARINGHELRLALSKSLEVVSHPSVDPETLFESENLEVAREVWDGEASRAHALPLDWVISASIRFERLLASDDVRVCAREQTLIDRVLAIKRLEDLSWFTFGEIRRTYISLQGSEAPLHLGSITFATAAVTDALIMPPIAPALPGEMLLQGDSRLAVLPVEVLPIEMNTSPGWNPVAGRVRAAAAALTWALLSSKFEVATQSAEFVGLKHAHLLLPPLDSWTDTMVQGTLSLRAWAMQEASPDRVLAIRQIASLYDDAELLLTSAPSISRSAEAIYVGLRTSAISEVVKSIRETEATVAQAVRQTVESSQGLLRSTSERVLAGLAAVGAALIGSATSVLTDGVSRALLLLVAGYFTLLLLSSVLLEGPLANSQLKNLRATTAITASVLTTTQIDEIHEAKHVQATRRFVKGTRIGIAVLYVLLIATIILFGYPGAFKNL